MIIRSRVVATMAGEPIDDGGVVVEANTIADVGRFREMKARHSGNVLDLGEQILLPGLINAHCHLDYTMLRGKIPPQPSFAAWIRAINAEKAQLKADEYLAAIKAGFAEAQQFGTTTIVNLTAFPELVAEIEEPIRTWWLGELIDVRNPGEAGGIVERTAASLRSASNWGLAPHAPFTASAQLYEGCTSIAQRENILLTTHLAESREEMQMFRDASGPLFDFLKSIGRTMEDCGKGTPLSLFLRNQTIDGRWIIAHLNELDAGDFDLLTRATKFHIAHCPRSHTFFGHAPFALERLRALGFNICLGTDSLASNSSLNLFSEMRELLRKEPWVSPREALTMATVNGARSVGQSASLGSIRPGFLADLIAIPSAGVGTDAFDAIIAFDGTVPWMMVHGEGLSFR
jgi:cytosine/adenosine deaminase-related metal-dependent hydrolase